MEQPVLHAEGAAVRVRVRVRIRVRDRVRVGIRVSRSCTRKAQPLG